MNMTPQVLTGAQARAILTFLERCPLRGGEAPAFMDIVKLLSAIVEEGAPGVPATDIPEKE